MGGDFNGDGIDDLTISGNTVAYVVFGANYTFARETSIEDIEHWGKIFTDQQPIKVAHRQSDDNLNSQYSSAKYLGSFGFTGDINHDGKADLGFENDMLTYHSHAYTSTAVYEGSTPYNITIPYNGSISYSGSIPYTGSVNYNSSAAYNGIIPYNITIHNTLLTKENLFLPAQISCL
ncbi:MAG: hypothetical protein MRQ09_00920 [Candidatus Midichloria sp.]|nr:hypothetical protein [Candidatus Midichloria sp.]